MEKYSLFKPLSLAVSIAALGLAYILAGHWWITGAFAGMILCWFPLKKWSPSSSATSLLSVYFLLAAVGVYINLSMILLIVGSTAALAAWDLILFSPGWSDSPSSGTSALMEKSHLEWLALAVAAGMVLAFLSRAIDLKLPFLLTAGLAGIAVGGLLYGIRFLGSGDRRG